MRTLVVMLMVAMIGSSVSAQQNPLKTRLKAAQAGRQRSPIDLEAEPASEPVDKVDVNELLLQRKDLIGKVIELEFDHVMDLKQTTQGYTARVTSESRRMAEGISLLIPTEGLEYFEPLSEHKGLKRGKVYVEILPAEINAAKALGTRYRKDKPEGERYSW